MLLNCHFVFFVQFPSQHVRLHKLNAFESANSAAFAQSPLGPVYPAQVWPSLCIALLVFPCMCLLTLSLPFLHLFSTCPAQPNLAWGFYPSSCSALPLLCHVSSCYLFINFPPPAALASRHAFRVAHHGCTAASKLRLLSPTPLSVATALGTVCASIRLISLIELAFLCWAWRALWARSCNLNFLWSGRVASRVQPDETCGGSFFSLHCLGTRFCFFFCSLSEQILKGSVRLFSLAHTQKKPHTVPPWSLCAFCLLVGLFEQISAVLACRRSVTGSSPYPFWLVAAALHCEVILCHASWHYCFQPF